jgi:phosphoglucomutase
MTLDWDGKIRMDCSSPYAMASLIAQKDRFQIATGNDADADRHGIVTPDGGLMNPNHYLSVAISYLYTNRGDWPGSAAVGKTLVSSSMIDRVAADLGRRLDEVPVGFKWFVPGLLDGSIGFGGEESAGASFLRRDGSVWSTDKDGMLLDLRRREIHAPPPPDRERATDATSRPSRQPGVRADLRGPPTREEKAILAKLSPQQVTATEAGRRADHRGAEQPGNVGARSRPEGGERDRLVRARPSGNPRTLQDLGRVVPRPGPPPPNPGGARAVSRRP